MKCKKPHTQKRKLGQGQKGSIMLKFSRRVPCVQVFFACVLREISETQKRPTLPSGPTQPWLRRHPPPWRIARRCTPRGRSPTAAWWSRASLPPPPPLATRLCLPWMHVCVYSGRVGKRVLCIQNVCLRLDLLQCLNVSLAGVCTNRYAYVRTHMRTHTRAHT